MPDSVTTFARSFGFSHALEFDPRLLMPREDVRAMCRDDRCGAYGKNWTCPPHCGTLEECRERMHSYRHGILVQTVGQLSKEIDTRGIRAAEQQHLSAFSAFCDAFRQRYPEALCLGSGGCRVCSQCAYPLPCRFPDRAIPSMEGYGLFVTQVCRDCGAEYYHGSRTVTFTACILY